SFDDAALAVDQQQVGCNEGAEVATERRDPEMIEQLRVPDGDVPRGPLVEAETREHPVRRDQPVLAPSTLVGHLVRHHRNLLGAHVDSFPAGRPALEDESSSTTASTAVAPWPASCTIIGL